MSRGNLLDLNEVLQHPGRKLDVEITTSLPGHEDIELARPLLGSLQIVSTGNQLLIKGQFKTCGILDCARCSRPLEIDMQFEIDEAFDVIGTPSSYGTKDFARVVSDEPFALFEKNALIVDELLYQLLLVSLPLQPLCKYGWEGECPEARKKDDVKEGLTSHRGLEKLKVLLDQTHCIEGEKNS